MSLILLSFRLSKSESSAMYKLLCVNFRAAHQPKADNENLASGSRFPRRFTDCEVEAIERLLRRYYRLGHISSWQMACSRKTSLFMVHSGQNGDNHVLNIRKFNKDGLFYYAASAKLTKTNITTLNFSTVMSMVQSILDNTPQIRESCLQSVQAAISSDLLSAPAIQPPPITREPT